ncbi:unnamed protein product [Closterium sp. NIES-54]
MNHSAQPRCLPATNACAPPLLSLLLSSRPSPCTSRRAGLNGFTGSIPSTISALTTPTILYASPSHHLPSSLPFLSSLLFLPHSASHPLSLFRPLSLPILALLSILSPLG